MSHVIVLAGGTSDEREVSLRSGQAVAEALRIKYQVTVLNPADGLPTDQLQVADVIFPLLHGAGGEDGSLQKQLDELGVAYVGSGYQASAICFDKWQYKQLLAQQGLPTPNGQLVDEAHFENSPLSLQPFVLKPFDGGSSVDTYICRDVTALNKNQISGLFSRHPKMLLEALIDGTEITVAVFGDRALPVIEIIPPADGEFDYENKYNGQSQELCPPQNVAEVLQQQAQKLALQSHHLTGCRDFSRTDIMIDRVGQLWLLETNTIPGMTNQSLFPKAAAVAGISMPKLVDQLVQMALARKTT